MQPKFIQTIFKKQEGGTFKLSGQIKCDNEYIEVDNYFEVVFDSEQLQRILKYNEMVAADPKMVAVELVNIADINTGYYDADGNVDFNNECVDRAIFEKIRVANSGINLKGYTYYSEDSLWSEAISLSAINQALASTTGA